MPTPPRDRRLALYLAAARRIPFSYETGHDCAGGLLARWIEAERGIDPAGPWRGRYRTALGCHRMVKRAGGLVALLDDAARRAGLDRVDEPQLGDVGAVVTATPEGRQAVGAIRSRLGWAMLTARGLHISTTAPVLAAWRV